MTGAEGPTTPCPFDGCERSFASPNAAAQHVHRSKKHPVDTWDKARDMVESDGGNNGEPAERDHDPDDDGEDDGEPAERDHDPDDDPTTGDGDPSAAGLPRCDKCGQRDLFDASAHTDYEYGCRRCSDADTWYVFDADGGDA